MGGSQSAQCNLGTFGTGTGIPVEYKGFKINLGGSDICQNTIAECANECQAMGCGSSGEQWGDCCKMCERSCCQPGPAFNPNSTVCKQLSYNAIVPLPDDYCTNPVSRKQYDDECPSGCLGSQSDDMIQQLPSNAVIADKTKTCSQKWNFLIFAIMIILLLLFSKL